MLAKVFKRFEKDTREIATEWAQNHTIDFKNFAVNIDNSPENSGDPNQVKDYFNDSKDLHNPSLAEIQVLQNFLHSILTAILIRNITLNIYTNLK